MKRELTKKQHDDDLLRRRIKFVVEKAAMARLFRKGRGRKLQSRLFDMLKPQAIASLKTKKSYEKWLTQLIESNAWKPFTRYKLDEVRWPHFAKLVNIITYEIISNRELVGARDWERLKWFVHVPLDKSVGAYLRRFDGDFPRITRLKGMTEDNYFDLQKRVCQLGERLSVPPIWFEAGYSTLD
jgi:hypothetical protein